MKKTYVTRMTFLTETNWSCEAKRVSPQSSCGSPSGSTQRRTAAEGHPRAAIKQKSQTQQFFEVKFKPFWLKLAFLLPGSPSIVNLLKYMKTLCPGRTARNQLQRLLPSLFRGGSYLFGQPGDVKMPVSFCEKFCPHSTTNKNCNCAKNSK